MCVDGSGAVVPHRDCLIRGPRVSPRPRRAPPPGKDVTIEKKRAEPVVIHPRLIDPHTRAHPRLGDARRWSEPCTLTTKLDIASRARHTRLASAHGPQKTTARGPSASGAVDVRVVGVYSRALARVSRVSVGPVGERAALVGLRHVPIWPTVSAAAKLGRVWSGAARREALPRPSYRPERACCGVPLSQTPTSSLAARSCDARHGGLVPLKAPPHPGGPSGA